MKTSTSVTNKMTEKALPLKQCLAKTYGDKQEGRQVLEHCQIVGVVAHELIARMPKWLSDDLFPEGSELIAACHDIGKVSPTFQKKIYSAIGKAIAELKNTDPELEKQWGGHAGVSQATAKTLAKTLKIGKWIPEILGQHHGFSPNLGGKNGKAEDFGGEVWFQRREELLTELKRCLNCDFPTVTSPEHARVLAGLTSVADWIGSGSLFDDPAIEADNLLIQQAVDNAGFIKPKYNIGLNFSDIFPFQPHDSQTKLIESANQAGVYILEAPMGMGKTEAALFAAYQLMAKNQATGLYFALPTQLTSDKIHDRVNLFLNKILVEDSPHRNALLAHGSAWLKDIELGKEGNPDGSWFDEKKRRLLAPFAVGTIDQALMAVMNVRHGFVRSFGLVGKVVILDEVHSYDMYTGTILEALVKNLRLLHCTVIILSATLTTERRKDLLGEMPRSDDYPLISAQPNQQALQELKVNALESKKVIIHCCQTEDDALYEALDRVKQGQQVLWIENTVVEAQEKFNCLQRKANQEDIKCEIGLLHSRFLKTDRADNEQYWVELYGKDNEAVRKAKGRILVGTQVLEQSLDIDADFLITRFAPTDMLLQRIGRLWRHETTDRNKTAQRETWLLAPELNAAIENTTLFGDSAKVYSPYVLCRSLAVWHKLPSIQLPPDIRPLIEATYKDCTEQGEMQRYKAELDKKRTDLKSLAQFGLSTAGKTLPDESASTRYSEQDSVQVLLLKAYSYNENKHETTITLLNNTPLTLPQRVKADDKAKWRDLASQLLQNTVQVTNYHAPQAVSIKALEGLREFIYLGKHERDESLLRIALVDESGDIKNLAHGAASEKYALSYGSKLGYRATK